MEIQMVDLVFVYAHAYTNFQLPIFKKKNYGSAVFGLMMYTNIS
jgi:hypothetical protein